MPDEFWFEVTRSTEVYASDGTTVVGRLETAVPYRAMDANEHWLAIPGPNGSRGYVAIAELDYREIDAPGSGNGHGAAATEDSLAAVEVDHHDDEATDEGTADDEDLAPGAADTTAFVHAVSTDTDDEDDDPSARQRRLRLFGAIGGGVVVVLILLMSMTGGGDSASTTTTTAATTTTVTTTTTTTPPRTTGTTLPPAGTTPAAETAPKNFEIVFYNDFEQSRNEAFPVGEITAQATGSLVDGAYQIDIERQRSMETLLQVPLVARRAFFGVTVEETRLEPGAHVCGVLFTTDEELYVISVNAEVVSGPREFAMVDGSGNEILPVTGSTVVQPERNHVAVLVKAPTFRLFINGKQVAKGEIDGNQFTGFGLTYGATSSGRCTFDDVEVWRPTVTEPAAPEPENPQDGSSLPG